MNMRLIFAVGLLAVSFAGCTTAQPITLPDGSQGQLLRCGGIQRTIADCYAKAGEVCPMGYDVVDERGESHPFIVGGGGFSATPASGTGGYSMVGGRAVQRTLMVRCHGRYGSPATGLESGYHAGQSVEPVVVGPEPHGLNEAQ